MKKNYFLIPLIAILMIGMLSLAGCNRYLKTENIKEDTGKVVNNVVSWIDENNIPEKMKGVFDSASSIIGAGISEAEKITFEHYYEDGYVDGRNDKLENLSENTQVYDAAENDCTIEKVGYACGYYDGYNDRTKDKTRWYN